MGQYSPDRCNCTNNANAIYNRPGIGISVAKAFTKHFNRIAICARNAERLLSEAKELEDAAKSAGRSIEVFTFPTDLTDVDSLRKTFQEVEKLGPLGMVYHNAATIRFKEILTETVEELEHDFRVRLPSSLFWRTLG